MICCTVCWCRMECGGNATIYGWRKRCLYGLILALFVVVLCNLVTTLLILNAINFNLVRTNDRYTQSAVIKQLCWRCVIWILLNVKLHAPCDNIETYTAQLITCHLGAHFVTTNYITQYPIVVCYN